MLQIYILFVARIHLRLVNVFVSVIWKITEICYEFCDQEHNTILKWMSLNWFLSKTNCHVPDNEQW